MADNKQAALLANAECRELKVLRMKRRYRDGQRPTLFAQAEDGDWYRVEMRRTILYSMSEADHLLLGDPNA